MKILGIETSCDDTGIAIIDEKKNILYNKIFKQEHEFGVIPEVAARAHFKALYDNIKKIEHEFDLVAYTNGPGLMGSLFIGSSFAKGLAYSKNLPTIAINHIQAHILLPYWMKSFEFPFLCLLISGGHTQLVVAKNLNSFEIISKTLDDSVGEVFDKVARFLKLKYPGGPEIEKMAQKAVQKGKFKFPKVMKNDDNFSFSGLKTAAIELIKSDCNENDIANFCNDFQDHIAYLLSEKFTRINKKYNIKNWVISGGVAANLVIRKKIEEAAAEFNANVYYTEPQLCTDNGLMIAATAQLLWPIVGKTAFHIKCDPNWKLPF